MVVIQPELFPYSPKTGSYVSAVRQPCCVCQEIEPRRKEVHVK